MFDSHLHLQDERFDACRDAVMAAALAAGVTGGCCCGSAPGDWEAVEELAEKYPTRGAQHTTANTAIGRAASPFAAGTRRAGDCAPYHDAKQFHGIAYVGPSSLFILPAFGVHPWFAGKLPVDWLTQLEELLVRHPEAPVGEIGIDGLRGDPPRDVQRHVLCAQLEMAARLHRPVALHGARAWGELLACIKPFAPRLPGFVAHAFGGSDDILHAFVSMGGYVSFAGPVCNSAAKRVRAAAAAAPSERLLIETDAPDMLPQGQNSEFRIQNSEGEKPTAINHPANLVYVARAVAELRGMPVEEIAAITTANAQQVYRIAEPV